MICGVTWAVECVERCALCGESLTVVDVVLAGRGLILVDSRVWAESEEVWDAIGVIVVPVCQYGLVNCCALGGENALEGAQPGRFAFACVNKETFRAVTD